jgi:nitrite reductase (NADH) small subunit/3-phenylpropionate/trans-cinnamate dioxygenase ferredoxin subunit
MPENDWKRIGTRNMFRRGRGRTIEIDGTRIAIFNERGKLHALDDACPHMGASLADGQIKDGQVFCSWHHWSFSLQDGHCTMRDWKAAASHPLKTNGEDVYVKLQGKTDDPPLEQDGSASEDELIPWDESSFFKKDGS